MFLLSLLHVEMVMHDQSILFFLLNLKFHKLFQSCILSHLSLFVSIKCWVKFVVTIKAKCFNHCCSIDEIDHILTDLGQAIWKPWFQLFNVLDQKSLVHWKNYNSNICDTKVFFQGRIKFLHGFFYHCLPSHTLHVLSNMQNELSFCSLVRVYKHVVSFKWLFFKQVLGG